NGIAMIEVEESGQNNIIVAAGANGTLTVADIDRLADVLRAADTLLLQLEVPLPVVERAAEAPAAGGARAIVNPAPAAEETLPPQLLRHVTILIPNETEAEALTGQSDPYAAAEALRAQGVATAVITLGEKGALLATETGFELIPG